MKTNKAPGLECSQVQEQLEKDESFGIIPLRRQGTAWLVFIIKQKAGHVGFPKGHRNDLLEDDKAAAERELKEETGLLVKDYYPFGPFTVNYECVSHGKHVNKYVTYFVAEVEGHVQLCPQELEDGKWVTLAEACQLVSFQNIKLIVDQLQKLLIKPKDR